jgi:hypothetical protein
MSDQVCKPLAHRIKLYGDIPLTRIEADAMIDLVFKIATVPDSVLWCALEVISEGARSRVHQMSADRIKWVINDTLTVSRGEVNE